MKTYKDLFFSLLIIKGLQKKNQLLKRHTEKERKRERELEKIMITPENQKTHRYLTLFLLSELEIPKGLLLVLNHNRYLLARSIPTSLFYYVKHLLVLLQITR